MPDRRRFRRSGVQNHGIVRARLRPAHDVSVIDVSAGGMLIEATVRLLPGTYVELQLISATEGTALIRGRVLRCRVTRLTADGIGFRGAIAFERELPWFAGDAPLVCAAQIGDAEGQVLVWPPETVHAA